MKSLLILWLFYSMTLLSCDSQPSSQQHIKKSIISDTLIDNIEKKYPSFKVSLDNATEENLQQYNTIIQTDTTGCSEFIGSRILLGYIKNVKATVKQYGNDNRIYLLAGNLKLWLCNLPKAVTITADTVIVTGAVYDLEGNEKSYGFPTILTNVLSK